MSRNYFRCISITILFFTFAATPRGEAQNAAPLGMVLQVEGGVTVRRGTSTKPVELADFLLDGDQITTAANGRLRFSFCPSNERVSIAGGSAIAVAGSAFRQSRGPAAVRMAGAKCALPQVALGKRDIDHIGGLVARGVKSIAVFTGGPLTNGRPRFAWTPVANAQRYNLAVFNAAGSSVWTWEQMGQASEVQLPDSVPQLEPGSYSWELSARSGTTLLAQQATTFQVQPAPQFAAVKPTDAASELELAISLIEAHYYSEAAAIYRKLRSQNNNDVRLTNELIWLYGNAGLFPAETEEREKLKK